MARREGSVGNLAPRRHGLEGRRHLAARTALEPAPRGGSRPYLASACFGSFHHASPDGHQEQEDGGGARPPPARSRGESQHASATGPRGSRLPRRAPPWPAAPRSPPPARAPAAASRLPRRRRLLDLGLFPILRVLAPAILRRQRARAASTGRGAGGVEGAAGRPGSPGRPVVGLDEGSRIEAEHLGVGADVEPETLARWPRRRPARGRSRGRHGSRRLRHLLDGLALGLPLLLQTLAGTEHAREVQPA